MTPSPSPRPGALEAAPDPVSAELLVRGLAAARNGIVVVDAHGDMPIRYVNAGFCRMTGYRPEDVLGRNCRFLQGPEPDPDAAAAFRAALEADEHRTVLVRNYRADGVPFWNEVELSPVITDGVTTHYIGVQDDVTARVEAEDRARFLAERDPLTGLANRRGLQQRLDEAIRRASASGQGTALLFLDVDDFKRVNDLHGHAVGDDLLRQLASRLEAVVRPGDLLARTGGDEFALVLTTGAEAERVGVEAAERVLRALEDAFVIEGDALGASVSIGVSTLPGDASSPVQLLQHADAAMYEVKRAGGSGRRVHSGRSRGAAPAGPEVVVVPADASAELDAILAAGAIRSVYQPLVELDSHRIVGYEALARGPEGSSLARPDLLFATAAADGRTHELEWACRSAALRGALDGLPAGATLFVNVEPSSLSHEEPGCLRDLMAEAVERLPVVLELTERALTDSPSAVLDAVPRLRERGFAIALDDVGADVRSVALMPFLRPDVIKLDLRLVQDRPTPALAAIAHAVNAEAERSGAMVLAEGIEDPVQEETARALGARFGQGWRFGRPAPLDADAAPTAVGDVPGWSVSRVREAGHGRTPFDVVRERTPVRTGTKGLLLSMSRHLEAQVAARGGSSVLLATFQEARHFTPATQARYRRMAQSAAFVGALGVNMGVEPAPGVRGADLSHTEKLRGEWDVVVVDPHFAGAFVAQDLGDVDRPDMERRFAFCVTYDRDLVVEAARSLMRRIRPLPG